MEPNNFKIVFGTDSHEVDIETLVGCLMHTSNIIQEVNKHLETDKKIEVKIKALKEGSFEVHIELVEKLFETLFSGNALTKVAEVVAVVGGLYKLVGWLQGKLPKNVSYKDEGVEITNQNNETIIININVYNTFNENKIIRDSISKQFVILDKNEEITGFKFESNNISTYIQKEKFKGISKKLDTLDESAKEPITDILLNRKILIIRPSFDKDLKWDFVFEGQKLSAKMEDEAMIKIIDNGEEFSKGDYMLVDLEVTKFYDTDLETHLITKDSYKIVRYKQHIKSPKMGKLF